jgi:hypothetical protein
MELIKSFLEDVEAIMEPDSRLKFWEKEMRDIAHEAKAIIGTYENTRDASILKNMEAENKVVQEISMIKKKIQEITERRVAYGIEHVEASNSMTQRRYQRRPPSQYSEKSVVIGFEDHVFEIPQEMSPLCVGPGL